MNFESIKYILLSSIYILLSSEEEPKTGAFEYSFSLLYNPETTLRIEEKTVSEFLADFGISEIVTYDASH